MEMKNTKERYGVVAQVFHWAIFALFVGLFVVAEMMEEAPKGPGKYALYDLHKSLGVSVLFLAFARISWRMANPKPQLEGTLSKGIEKAASASHFLLYAVMFIMPLGGYIMSVTGGHPVGFFGLFKLPMLMGKNHDLHEAFEEVHEVMAVLILVLVSVHLLAALWHHFVVKDNVLRRMLPVKLK